MLYLEELHDLVLCGVAGDEVVQVGDDVDADGTGELVPALGDGDGGGHQGGEEEEGCLHHHLAFVLSSCCLRSFSAMTDDELRKLSGFIVIMVTVPHISSRGSEKHVCCVLKVRNAAATLSHLSVLWQITLFR